MKAPIFFFLILFFITMSAFVQANDRSSDGQANSAAHNELDFCYKPSKPLFFSTAEYKKRYADDMKEYQRCHQSFIEMQARIASMKKESEKNARLVKERFAKEQFQY